MTNKISLKLEKIIPFQIEKFSYFKWIFFSISNRKMFFSMIDKYPSYFIRGKKCHSDFVNNLRFILSIKSFPHLNHYRIQLDMPSMPGVDT